jgi:hypothetical protein
MKVLLLTLLFSIASIAQSEFRLNKKESGNLGVVTGLNNVTGIEVEYSGTFNAKFFITNKSVGGAIGLNFTSGMYERFIYQIGVRLHKKTDTAVAIAGVELGVKYKLSDTIFIGLAGVYDLKVEKGETIIYPNCILKLGFNF